MRLNAFRAVVLGFLIFALTFPAGNLAALAQEQPPQQKPEQQKPEQQKPEQQKPEQQPPGYAISVEVPVVNVDVVVTDNNGNYLTTLKKENFRVLDDGQPQVVTNFASTEAPITAVLLIEFSRLGYGIFAYNAADWAYQFLNELKPNDWVALVTFDLHSRIDVDFTHNKQEVRDALSQLMFPGFSEANLFDAIYDTVDRLQDVKGKKAILLLASGFDTFSKHTLDQTLKRLRDTDVTIFSVGVGESLMEWADNHGYLSGIQRVGYYQAQNQMRTFAEMTGGRAWFPRFEGELPDILRDVAASLRSQYSLAYIPSNRARDVKYHKIKVQLVAPDGGPLTVVNQKGKKVKFVVYARQGYTAPKGSVGD